MHRTEQSAIWIDPKNGAGPSRGSYPDAGDTEQADFILQDMALAYGPHMPTARILFSNSGDRRALTTRP